MDRRHAVAAFALLSGIAAFPKALAQGRKSWRIGFLANDPTIPTTPAGKAFVDGLREHGLVEGKNLVIERRFAEGNLNILSKLAAELVSMDLDLIVATSSTATLAVKKATAKISIVMVNVTDPVVLGIVPSLGLPQGNITGLINDVSSEITSKRLQLLKEAFPAISRIAVLTNPDNQVERLAWDTLERVAPTLGVTVQAFPVRQGNELVDVFTKIKAERPDALLGLSGGLILTYRRVIVALAAEHRLPAMYAFTEVTRDGGLMSYAANRPDIYRRAAAYVARILGGARPADLPIEQPRKYELVLNMKTAKALELTFPSAVVLRADELIE